MLQVLLNQRLGSSRCASSHFLTKSPQFLATPSYVKRFQNWNWRLRANAFANCIKTKKKNLSYCNKPKREERLSWDWIYHQKTSDLWSFHRISHVKTPISLGISLCARVQITGLFGLILSHWKSKSLLTCSSKGCLHRILDQVLSLLPLLKKLY